MFAKCEIIVGRPVRTFNPAARPRSTSDIGRLAGVAEPPRWTLLPGSG